MVADAVAPNQDGLMLYVHAGSAGETALYFYDFAAQRIKTIATPTAAPDGTERGISASLAAGHWVVYTVTDANNAHWSLRAVNTQTGEDHLIDSYAEEGSAPLANMYGVFASDGADLVWSAGIQTTGAPAFVLKDYTFASQQTRTLMSGSNTPSLRRTPSPMAASC